jgi:hypothetical protein
MSTPLMTDSKVDAEQLQAFAMQMRAALFTPEDPAYESHRSSGP